VLLKNNVKVRKMNKLKNIPTSPGLRKLLFGVLVILLLVSISCSGSRGSQSARHRSPASTGKSKCGCSMLSPAKIQNLKISQLPAYALQA